METNIQPPVQPENTSGINYNISVKPKTNLLTIIILVVVIFLIFAGSFILGKYFTENKNEPVLPPTPIVQQPTIIPTTDPTTNWKTYKNTEFRYEVKYPPELTFTEERSDIFLFQTNFQKKQTGYLNGFIITITKNDSVKNALAYWRWRVVGHISDQIDQETTIKVNNLNAVKLDYTALDNKKFSFIIIPKDSYNYVIQSSANEVDKILSTLQITE